MSRKGYIEDDLFSKIQDTIPIVCIDLVVVEKFAERVLLFRRSIFPEVGKWVNIGGRILKGERLEEAIRRHAKDELDARVAIISPYAPERPLAVFSEPTCDLQKHPVSLVYPVVLLKTAKKSGPEFSESRWFSIDQLPTDIGFEPLHRKEIMYVSSSLRHLL